MALFDSVNKQPSLYVTILSEEGLAVFASDCHAIARANACLAGTFSIVIATTLHVKDYISSVANNCNHGSL
ncbi:hypothetical protein [Marivivens donghaensis]|uniref:hypothetical protein n=1 Tax=Marivivens donghaensis TaxID=1699413 RepID=UPI00201F2398|nr:hypothetical protein [Marivivens donghaensis]MCL7409992.1 hypothetical protein [Marivivens donghaensis]MDN3705407.1 hypothetical protein [Marivivens donghaensis]